MRPHDMTFFVDEDKSLHVHMNSLVGYARTKVIHINTDVSKYTTPRIAFFVEGEEALIAFKNAALWAYESYERTKKNAKDI